MMVTKLSPVTGYDNASVISYYAIDPWGTLKQAALASGVSEGVSCRVTGPLATDPRRPGRHMKLGSS